jgi:hypothetical protein
MQCRYIKSKVLVSIIVLLCLSVALNAILFLRARDYYLELNSVRLDPLGLRSFTSEWEAAVPDSQNMRVVFFGDSRAAQWPEPEHLTSFHFVNRGVGNQTSAQVLGRFDTHIAPIHPKVLVIQVGINDLKAIPLFPERKQEIIANCKLHIQQLVERATAQGMLVILTTIFPVGDVPFERKLFWSADVEQAINEVNIFLQTLQSSQVVILDSYSLLAEDGTTQADFAQDTLHKVMPC